MKKVVHYIVFTIFALFAYTYFTVEDILYSEFIENDKGEENK